MWYKLLVGLVTALFYFNSLSVMLCGFAVPSLVSPAAQDWIKNCTEWVSTRVELGLTYLAIWIDRPSLILIPLVSIVIAALFRYMMTFSFRVSSKTDILLSLPTDFAFLSVSLCITAFLVEGDITTHLLCYFLVLIGLYALTTIQCGLEKENVYISSVAIMVQDWWNEDKANKYVWFRPKIKPVFRVRKTISTSDFRLNSDILIPRPSRKFWLIMLLSVILYGITITALGNQVFPVSGVSTPAPSQNAGFEGEGGLGNDGEVGQG